jgi:hypothetical protein
VGGGWDFSVSLWEMVGIGGKYQQSCEELMCLYI